MISDTQQAFEARALKLIFSEFEKHNVRYAVLRNYESLPESVGARDIDIVVLPEDLKNACKAVTEIADQMSLRHGNFYADERLTQFALVCRGETNELHQLKIDFFIRSEVYGTELLSAKDMLNDIKHHKGIPVVSDRVLMLDK